MSDLPTGTVTFLFTDLEGSTRLWQDHPAAARVALIRHDELVEQIVADRDGHVVRPRGEGDSRFAVFARASEAVAAAAALQQALYVEPWPTPTPLRVRMALHTGEADLRSGDYYGSAVNRCARLRSVAHGGQTLVSLATQELVRDSLPASIMLRTMGEHRLRDLIRPERIFQLVVSDLPADFPPLKTLDARPNNLPVQRDALIGREQELEAVAALLRRDDVGLVTLTGPGGSGKTRLALQLAAELLDDFPDGVWFVDLASITDPTLVASAIATTLGLKEVSGESLVQTLQAFLRAKQLLLVLDNIEQVVSAASLLPPLLQTAARLKLLVTSRVVLHLSQEHEYPVPPLAVPQPIRPGHSPPSLKRLTQYAAVELFIHRAQRVKPDFQVTNQNASAVAEICVRLDGLPLAIELAAARSKLFTPQALLQRLGHPLGMLTGGGRDLHARHQTLRNTIDWSYQLLDAVEQWLFARLGVFVGGCTIEAAEAICFAPSDLPCDMVDGLASLVDKSLLRQTEGLDGEPRFHMLETIREYALERLAASGEAERLRQQHAAYYLALTETSEWELRGALQAHWLDRLGAEHDNLRAALGWSLESEAIDVGLRIAGGLVRFWAARGFQSEGHSWLNAFLARAVTPEPTPLPALAPDRQIAKALCGAGQFSWAQSDYALARTHLEESVSRWRQLADPHGLAEALHILGHVLSDQGDYAVAQAVFEESLTHYQAVGDTLGGLPLLGDLGLVAYHQGDYDAARAHFEQSLPLYRAQGMQEVVGVTLRRLGDLARIAGDYTQAARLYEESLAVFEALRSGPHTASVLHKLAYVAQQRGDYPHMHALLAESLRHQQQVGNKQGIAECLAGLAGWATAVKQPERAARLFGATKALLVSSGVPLAPADHAEYVRDRAKARAQLSDTVWKAASSAGQTMTLEQAIAYALEEAPNA